MRGLSQVAKLAMRWLDARATTKYFRAVAGDLKDIRNDPRLQAKGVSHPKSDHVPVVDANELPRVMQRLIIAVDLLERGTASEVSADQNILKDVL